VAFLGLILALSNPLCSRDYTHMHTYSHQSRPELSIWGGTLDNIGQYDSHDASTYPGFSSLLPYPRNTTLHLA